MDDFEISDELHELIRAANRFAWGFDCSRPLHTIEDSVFRMHALGEIVRKYAPDSGTPVEVRKLLDASLLAVKADNYADLSDRVIRLREACLDVSRRLWPDAASGEQT